MVEAVDKVAPGQVGMEVGEVQRAGFAATRCHVEIADSAHHRSWRDIRDLLHEKDRLGQWMPTVPVPPALDPGAAEPALISAASATSRSVFLRS